MSYRIVVIRGGIGNEHKISLQTGEHIRDVLATLYPVVDVVIDTAGVWHVQGFPKAPAAVLQHADVVVNALHGEYGEDGKVQQILEHVGIPYTGSGIIASAFGMDKAKAKKLFIQVGIKTPRATVVSSQDSVIEEALRIFKTHTLPVVIKPVSGGSSIGVSIGRDLRSIEDALTSVFAYSNKAMVEEYIKGKEVTCVVAEGFRGQDYYAFPPIEVAKRSDVVFDHTMKYEEDLSHVCPARLSRKESEQVMAAAIQAHKAIGARDYSRSDFILHPTRGLYILEINTLPGFTRHSFVPLSLQAVGSSTKEFLKHLIERARQR